MKCANNLKQIGLALHNYHDTNGTLPPGGDADRAATATRATRTWAIEILPYMEQDALYTRYNQLTAERDGTPTTRRRAAAGEDVRVPGGQRCAGKLERPRPGRAAGGTWMHGSYRAVSGRSRGHRPGLLGHVRGRVLAAEQRHVPGVAGPCTAPRPRTTGSRPRPGRARCARCSQMGGPEPLRGHHRRPVQHPDGRRVTTRPGITPAGHDRRAERHPAGDVLGLHLRLVQPELGQHPEPDPERRLRSSARLTAGRGRRQPVQAELRQQPHRRDDVRHVRRVGPVRPRTRST